MVGTVEVEERFLRPAAIKDNLDSSWSDTQHAWLRDKENGFICVAVLERQADGGVLIELQDRSKLVVNATQLLPRNATRFDRCEDMAEMSELSEATVLYNLRQRYDSNLIYTYSGLFLVAVNPYRHFPIYTEAVMQWYKNKKRVDRPPHIFAIADTAYRALIETRQNQSILITGESGAGKTENTKKVIQYLATIAGGSNHAESNIHALEMQIIRANPILEAFGNAQTGKFVRIEFNNCGAICGANIEKYLLEKSRVTHRNPKERNFHVFYQLLLGAPESMKNRLSLHGTPADYNYTKNSNSIVEGIDDRADFGHLVDSMRVLGFSEEEQLQYFRIVAAILLLGSLEFQEDAAGQAQLRNVEMAERACNCLGISLSDFLPALLNPVIKAGRDEIVAQSRDVSQVVYSVEALSRALYDRMFTKLVDRINKSIDRSNALRTNYIGVLDIAGFEIFEKNSFEQLCINHTNEKLQQFFNHHMFVIEQEEYKRESIEWSYIDFGLDLQPTIDLIERSNPIGVLACLDEDCVVPKATDKSFCEKICSLWRGKSGKFETTRFGDGFVIHHYAGKVEYTTEGWLVKNKDPLNENITRHLARSSHAFIGSLFLDFAGTDEEVYQATKGTKKGLFRTVAQKHRESLSLLMQQLYSTRPHFVRCIIPNGEKRPAVMDAKLVLEQLGCNGVLEGIRICRLGYPNRLPFADFCRLYEILASQPALGDARQACHQLLEQFGMQEGEAYRMGQSKVFFRAGELAKLEEIRDRKLSTVLRSFQAYYRFLLARRQRNRLQHQQGAVQLLQRNIRLYLRLRQWAWWKVFSQIKPLLNVTRAEGRIEELEMEMQRLAQERTSQVDQLQAELKKERDMLYELETRRRELEREKHQLTLQLNEANDSKVALMERKMLQEVELARLRERLATEVEEQRLSLEQRIASQERELSVQRQAGEEQRVNMAELKTKLDELEFERLKAEKSEINVRHRLAEAESLLEETRRSRRELEAKLRQSEETRRTLQEQLEDEAVEEGRRKACQAEFDAQVRQLRQEQEEDLQAREEEWERNRKRLQREVHQLTFDLEQEKKQSASLKETIKRYESGADTLATQLEAEMRSQSNWKREKERLEQRLKEVSRQNQETMEREDALHAQISQLSDQLRDLNVKCADLEEAHSLAERQRKTIEGRYESLGEQHRELGCARQALEKQCSSLEYQVGDLSARLQDQEDVSAIQAEQMRALEQVLRVAQLELEEERKKLLRVQQEKGVLEMQIKELQLKLLESETSTCNGGASSRPALRRPSSTAFSQLVAQIEAESAERQQLIKETRRQERTVRELQQQLGDRDRDRIGLEESLEKCELRLRKMQTSLELLETRNNELEAGKRRCERELAEEREHGERLAREVERLKSRPL